MYKNIVLRRPVEIQGYDVIGEVAECCERIELSPVLKRVRETGGTYPRELAEHLLFAASRKPVARRLLKNAELLGLLKENPKYFFTLTDQGKKTIETGEVFVPKHDEWTLWISLDSLLPSPILRVDLSKAKPAHIEVSRNPQLHDIPEYLCDAVGREITPPASNNCTKIRIDKLEDKVQKKEEEESDSEPQLSLLWNIGEKSLRLKGTWKNDEEVNTELQPPDISFDTIWDDLLNNAGLSEQWTREYCALQVSFSETDGIERETMARNLEFRHPSLPIYGQFESSKANQIPITAGTETDAKEWSEWRLNSRIRDFATLKLYSEWWNEASEPFSEFGLECPTRSSLASKAWKDTGERPDTRAWHLIAVEDWNLE